MRPILYKGVFTNGHSYIVYCFGFTDALFLLVAKAINNAKDEQLHSIEDEYGNIRYIKDISSFNLFYL